jgi:primosomal protein N' (replication factor Y)
MSSYAEVALPLGVDKTFTYLLPPELEEAGVIGVRVVVPFGRKYATGVIVGRPVQSDRTGLKPIRDVIDAEPLVSEELLQFCRWIADYYISPLGEVLKTALPQGFAPAGKRVVTALVNPADLPRELSPARKQVLVLLSGTGPLSVQDLARHSGVRNMNALLSGLASAGLVRVEELHPRPKRAARMKDVAEFHTLDVARLSMALRDLSVRKKKLRALLQTLISLKEAGTEAMDVTRLVRQSGSTSAAVKEALTLGILNISRREVDLLQEHGTEEQTLHISLNEAQEKVLAPVRSAIESREGRTFLLHGVTGSGKTQVYIEAIRVCLYAGGSAVVLVPEISLTPQIVRRFNSHFPGLVAVVHSRMSPLDRAQVWRMAARGMYRIVIGPRSAVFAPLQNLQLIVVDEEHEASYKQYDAMPRYHARDAAIVRSRICNAVVLLGSATPSMESYSNVAAGKYALLHLPARVDDIPMPSVTVVDMREERSREYREAKERQRTTPGGTWKRFQQSSLSAPLREKIADRLSRKEGVILLQNRRGFAPFVECMSCGYTETCERCSVTLTYHLAKKHLRCHYCGTVYTPHTVCPQCTGGDLQLRGIGTQRVEEELSASFPEAVVLRMDLDTTARKGAHERILRAFGDGQADILLGTQMVAKGLDFPRVTLVGVISADTQMLLPDFRASERTFQLLTQVAGRAGRSTLRGEVVIQTHQPGQYVLQHVLEHNFSAFYEDEIAARQELDYPPFSRLILVETKGKNADTVRREAERFRDLLDQNNGTFILLGPAPAVIEKVNDQYRWHLIIKAPRSHDPAGHHVRTSVRKALEMFNSQKNTSVRVTVDVDPVGLL